MKSNFFNDKNVKYDIIGKYGTEEIVFGDKVERLENDAFKDCISLKKIVWGRNITSGGSYVFENCKSIESVDVPSEKVFLNYCCDNYSSPLQYGAKLLINGKVCEKFYIPDDINSLTQIENLFGCSSIKEIHISSNNPYLHMIKEMFDNTGSIKKRISNFTHAFELDNELPKLIIN